MKADVTESIDFELGLQSSISPQKKNISMEALTQPSLTFDVGQQSQKLLKLDSIQKIEQSECQKPVNSYNNYETISYENQTQKLQILQQLQQWVSESFTIYNQRNYRIRNNQSIIEETQHKNRLMKDQILHIKDMTQYNTRKLKQNKKKGQLKRENEQKQINKKISEYWERVDNLHCEIQHLQQRLSQKKIMQKNKMKKSSQKAKQQSLSNFYQYNPYYPSPYYSHPYLPTYLPQDAGPQTKRSSQVTFNKQNSLQQLLTPHFLSKKTSFNQPGSPNKYYHQLQDNTNPESFKKDKSKLNIGKSGNARDIILIQSSGSKISGKWENSQQQKDVLQILENSQNIKNRLHIRSSNQSGSYSPTFPIDTPKFQMGKYEKVNNFSAAHQINQRISQQRSNNTSAQKEKLSPSKKKGQSKRGSQQQSKIRIDVEQSLSSMSKFSIQKRRRMTEQTIKQSRINIEMLQQQSKSGQASVEEANKSARQKSPVLVGKASANSSFQKILIEQGPNSQILPKISMPPLLIPTGNKKLRKVTQQQSDLFDSSGYPRNHTKNKPSVDKFSIKDVVLDQQNLALSVGASQMNTQIYNSPRLSTIDNVLPLETQVRFADKRKVTQQQQDDDDFLNINLLAVSKISKQKQLSQKNFKSIESDLDNSSSGKLYRSSMGNNNLKLRQSQMPIVQQQNDFYQQGKQKRANQTNKKRKVSGSRFSILNQPNFKQNQQRQA